MSFITHSTLAAAALLVGLGVAHAQTAQEHDAHHPDAPTPAQAAPAMPQANAGGMDMGKIMDGNMASMMRQMHGGNAGGEMRMMPTEHVEGRIAFLKTELKITDAQLPQWNAFADALRNGAGQMRGAMQGMHTGMQDS